MALRHLTLLFFFYFFAAGEPSDDRKALLAFLSNTPHSPRIQWNRSTSACGWAGVTCSSNRRSVIALRLPASGLIGPIPPATLGLLSSLRILSLRSNRLTDPIPTDLSNLTGLHSLYLQNNRLSGTFPPEIPHLSRLSKLDLSGNNFHGKIPSAVNNLTRLTGLFLQQNQFSGSLPSLSIPGLADFNVSFNTLNGSIPAALEKFPASSFAGNLQLCGPPLSPCAAPSPSPSPIPQPNSSKSSRKLSKKAIIVIAAAAGAGALVALLLLLCCCCCARRTKAGKGRKQMASGGADRSGDTGLTSSSKEESRVEPAGEMGRNRVMFVKGGGGGGYRFDLEDLLRASAEVLGKGSVGTSYKAVLEDGNAVVVKRLKDVAAAKRDFERNVEAIGKVDHRNLLPVRGYYYSKDEKLVVLDYVTGGSLSSNLHGNRGYGRSKPLEWDSRMRVAVAVGRGLAHLHGAATLVHGNIKASNVLLRPEPEAAALSDYGLGPLFGPGPAPANRATVGYRAPEVVQTRRPTFKSDVYSFGVLLLELLTGKAPSQATTAGDEGADLPLWVQSVVREEWTAEVFDAEVARDSDAEEEMLKVLQIAMACVALAPDKRPDMASVVRMMEDVTGSRGGAPEAGEGSKPPPVIGTP